jgi:hypothetical protein
MKAWRRQSNGGNENNNEKISEAAKMAWRGASKITPAARRGRSVSISENKRKYREMAA